MLAWGHLVMHSLSLSLCARTLLGDVPWPVLGVLGGGLGVLENMGKRGELRTGMRGRQNSMPWSMPARMPTTMLTMMRRH
ncbi:hypothetical protein F4808DRAFT_416833 [Astrocystis sublimbata]|nr:hypothetical protein F4808DRAFT_416833 [Astrocystis sublimbata]